MNPFFRLPFAVLFLISAFSSALAQTEILPIYPDGKIPLNKNCGVAEKVDTTTGGHPNHIRNVRKPEIWYWKSMKPHKKRVAVLIIPGGGYEFLSVENEGRKVAEKVLNEGYDAFVLKHRLPDETCMESPAWVPLTDAMAGLQKIRSYGYEKIGVIGFSAGGHVAGSLITLFDKNPHFPAVTPPDFACLVYPVISFSESVDMDSRKRLIGSDTTNPLVKQFSLENQVSPKTPPAILVHSVDDQAVSYINSELFFQAALKQKVHAEIHLYPSGGHGFGIGKVDHHETPDWMPLTMFFFDRYR